MIYKPAVPDIPASAVINSLLVTEGRFIRTAEVPRWVEGRRREQEGVVTPTPLVHLPQWRFEPGSGDLVHDSGKFFRVQGLKGRTNYPHPIDFDQPIVSQPEVGILGILAKVFDGVLYFLLQAKMEAGNINVVQLSPAVQATRSNYTQVHGGSRPRYLEYFTDRSMGVALTDQLQSEQGLFFLRKRNRNVIIVTARDVRPHDDYCWLTLGQIKQLLQVDNLINMDTRTVISAVPLMFREDGHLPDAPLVLRGDTFEEALLASSVVRSGVHTTEHVISWLTEIRATVEVVARPVPLATLTGWTCDPAEIRRDDGRYFAVIGVTASARSREVMTWGQPIVKPASIGTLAFVTQRLHGILHFLVQARLEPGLWNQVELAPTVQYLAGAVKHEDDNGVPYLDLVDTAPPEWVRHSSIQSEEGGRFYHYRNRNVIIEIPPEQEVDVLPNYRWMSLGQLNTLMLYGNYLNIEARSLLACLEFQGT